MVEGVVDLKSGVKRRWRMGLLRMGFVFGGDGVGWWRGGGGRRPSWKG